MKCADPKLCYTDGTKKILRHFSLANPVFRLIHNQVFNCGTCIFCRKKRATELAIRCVLHASLHKQNSFLTLTKDEKKETYHNDFNYAEIQEFKKKFRRFCEHHYNKKIQIFNVHEYGKNKKSHWHLVVFGHDFSTDPKPNYTKTLHSMSGGNPLYRSLRLERLWPHGFSTIGSVTEASALYQALYTQKDLKNGNSNNQYKSHSKHSGIGRDYFNQHYKQILSLGYLPFGGKRVPIFRYFQKLAHRHYCHFYDKGAFFDSPQRKRLYSPFKPGHENKEIADLFQIYSETKQKLIEQLTTEWEEEISKYIFNKDKPDFIISAENYLYDLKNKQQINNF